MSTGESGELTKQFDLASEEDLANPGDLATERGLARSGDLATERGLAVSGDLATNESLAVHSDRAPNGALALPGDVDVKGALLLPSDNFVKRESLAEMVVPYAYPTDVKNIFAAIAKTKMKRFLIDIDGPWIYSVGLSVLIALPFAINWVHKVWSQISHNQVVVLLFLATLMVTLPLLIPMYFLVAFTNLRLKYGKAWLRTIMGPTHIGLTTSGIKFYWKGQFFYNYPLLRVWSAIEKVDLNLPNEEHADVVPAINFDFAPRPFYKTRISLPLNGFSSRASLLRFLSLVQQWAPKNACGEVLEQDGDTGFKASIAAFDSLDVDRLLG